jgi:hypothetical protein
MTDDNQIVIAMSRCRVAKRSGKLFHLPVGPDFSRRSHRHSTQINLIGAKIRNQRTGWPMS